MTTRYIALIDGKAGAYGVSFPDAAGCAAMGKTMDEAMQNAVVSLAEWMADAGEDRPRARSVEELRRDPEVIEQIKEGAEIAAIPLLLEVGAPGARQSFD